MIESHEAITDEQKKFLCNMFENCSAAVRQIFYVTFLRNPEFIKIFARYAPEEAKVVEEMNLENFREVLKEELAELEKISDQAE